ncbi:hypothetical protein [Halopiger djelfimassiliensis]|uniref:hypothetical protein n=1 Tax=Halopiger djelfimassiliensis TaxID=1293047 RepID=UPI00067799AF|nr:hypothetical protein [Halopiger djelfimassiliensis]
MKRPTLIAIGCAVLIATTGLAAAAPGNAPASVDAGADDIDQRAADPGKQGGNGIADVDERDGQGPTVDLPEQVPDHVSAVHERISSFLSGTLDGSLGDAVSEVTPGADADDASDDESDSSGDDETTSDEDGERSDE